MRSAATWASVRDQFEPDGSLRDLYVLDVSLDAWETLLAHVRSRYDHDFELEGEPAEVPSVASLFRTGADPAARLLRIHRSDDRADDVNVHFFSDEEIEMDLDPRSIRDQVSFERLIGFMAGIADALGRPLVLTPENCPTDPILVVDPRE